MEVEELGIDPPTFWLVDDPLYLQLSEIVVSSGGTFCTVKSYSWPGISS